MPLGGFATLALATCAATQSFEDPVRIEADGAPITTEVGHSAPHLADIDGDGVHDLLVGQFGDGKLRIYRNEGTELAPRYGRVRWFEAEGETATVPAG
jgi:hypothetical protein